MNNNDKSVLLIGAFVTIAGIAVIATQGKGPINEKATATLSGTVKDSTGILLSGVNLYSGNELLATTNSSGVYEFTIASATILPDKLTISFTKTGYTEVDKMVTIVAGQNTLNITMAKNAPTPVATYKGINIYQSTSGTYSGQYYVTQESGYWSSIASIEAFIDANPTIFGIQATTGTLSGIVTDITADTPLPGVTVTIGSTTTTTDSNGQYSIAGIPVGNYTVTFSKSGYITITA